MLHFNKVYYDSGNTSNSRFWPLCGTLWFPKEVKIGSKLGILNRPGQSDVVHYLDLPSVT